MDEWNGEIIYKLNFGWMDEMEKQCTAKEFKFK